MKDLVWVWSKQSLSLLSQNSNHAFLSLWLHLMLWDLILLWTNYKIPSSILEWMKKQASSGEADTNSMVFIFDELDCPYLPQDCWAVIYKLLQKGQKSKLYLSHQTTWLEWIIGLWTIKSVGASLEIYQWLQISRLWTLFRYELT